MDNNGPVTNKRSDTLLGRDVVVGEHHINLEKRAVGRGNFAVFASEVANLARSREHWVAGSGLATLVRVEMGKGAVAIARAGNGLVVNVVGVRANFILEAPEANGTFNPSAVEGGSESSGTHHGTIGRESGNITSLIEDVSGLIPMRIFGEDELPCAFRVVVNDCRVTELASFGGDGGSEKRARKSSEKLELHLDYRKKKIKSGCSEN